MKRVSINSLEVGVPLPFNCYETSGVLLLRRGNLIANQRQLDFLVERGLYYEPATPAPVPDPKPVEEQITLHGRYAQLKDKLKWLLSLASDEFAKTDNPAKSEESQEGFKERYAKAKKTLDMQFQSSDESRKTGFEGGIIRLAREIQAMCAEDADATLAAIHIDSDGTYGVFHAFQRAFMCELIAANHVSSSDERLPVVCAALTADLSMFAVQEQLFKQGTPLDEEQRIQINRHPLDTSLLLYERGIKNELWINGVLHHHERLDGSGYPFGLRGDDVGYSARLLAVADIYAAMISARTYRENKLPKAALREIFLQRGNAVDARIALTFVKELGIFPPGSFVRLHNAEIAVVVKRGQNAKCPLVKSVVGPRGSVLERPLQRDTANSEYEIMEMIPREKSVPLECKRLWH